MSEKAYELFVSYAEADREWVEGFLLDALRTAAPRILTQRDFPLGSLWTEQFERAVQASSRVLLVLSSAYLADLNQQFVDQLNAYHSLKAQGSSVIVVLLEDVELRLGLEAIVKLRAHTLAEREAAVTRLCEELGVEQAISPQIPCPYPGMRPYQMAEKERFCGRRSECAGIIHRLSLQQCVFLIGPSGAGKSSLAMAGVVPALPDSQLFGAANWHHKVIRPGEWSGNDSILSVVDRMTQNDTRSTAKIILIVDQYEEAFTQLTPIEREGFEGQLLKWIDEGGGARHVVVTVRADFYSDLMHSPVWRRFRANHVDVLPLDRANLREAILEPARKSGVFVERTLIEHLLNDAIGEPGSLSLLQETMRLIWEKLERRFLSHDSYRSLTDGPSANAGTGLQMALAAVADSAFSELSTTQQEIAMRVFLRLVQFGQGRPDTRRQQRVSRLQSQTDDKGIFEATLQHLVQSRLVVVGDVEKVESASAKDPPVDLAHEQLIISWPKFQRWLAARRDAEVIRRRLEDKAAESTRLGRLLDEIELKEAEVWSADTENFDLGVSKELVALIDVSKKAVLARQKADEDARFARQKAEDDLRDQQERARNARQTLLGRVAIGAGIASVVLLGVSVFAVLQWKAAGKANIDLSDTVGKLDTSLENEKIARGQADTSKDIALAQASRAIANLAASEGQRALESDPALAVALASRSLRLSPTNRARQLLFDAVRALPVYNELKIGDASKKKKKVSLFHNDSPLRRACFTPSGRQILIVRSNGSVAVWNPDTQNATDVAETIHHVRSVAVAQMANCAAFLSDKKVVVCSFDVNGSPSVTREFSGEFIGAQLSADGGLLVAFEKIKVVAFSMATGLPIDIPVDHPVLAVAISRNNLQCAVLMEDGQLALFSLSDGRPLRRVKSAIQLSREDVSDFLLPQTKLREVKDALKEAEAKSIPGETKQAAINLEAAEKTLRGTYKDALGVPIPALTTSGYATKAIMSLTREENSKTNDVTIEFTADDAAVFLNVTDSSTLEVEVWNASLTERVFHRKGLFSKATLRSDGGMIAIAGPSSIQTFAISRGEKLQVNELQGWSGSMETERLGEPVTVVFSHHGQYVATVHSPAIMLQGARSSSASLWCPEEVDSRDGNTHLGHRLNPYSARIDSIDFSLQDDRVLTTDVDGTIRVWKIISGHKLFNEESDGPDYGRYIVEGLSYLPDETVKLLDTQFKSDIDLISAAQAICRRTLSLEEEKSVGIIDPNTNGALSAPKPEPLRYAWCPAAWYEPDAKVYGPVPGNEALHKLAQEIMKGEIKDADVGHLYVGAVKRDILLLSGTQNRWAAAILADANAANCAEAAIIMGLSGDRDTVTDLQKARSPSRTVTELKAIDWAIGFLERQGRDLSLSGIATPESIQTLEATDLCCWPRCSEAELRPKDLDLSNSTRELKQAASQHHAYDPNRSLASFAFALAVTGRDRGDLLRMIAEFYEMRKDIRSARQFAEAWQAIDAGNADVENLLGNLDEAEGKLDEGIAHFRRSLELGRVDGWPDHNLGRAFEKKKDLAAAEAHFRAALGRRDDVRHRSELAQFLNAAAWFLVTHFEADAVKMEDALKFSEEANKITKQANPNYLDTLALCKFMLGNVDDAIQIEETALKLLKDGDELRLELTQRLARFKAKRP